MNRAKLNQIKPNKTTFFVRHEGYEFARRGRLEPPDVGSYKLRSLALFYGA